MGQLISWGDFMLRILCSEEPENMLNTPTHLFNQSYKPDWFNDPLVEEIVLDIDSTKHIRDQVFDSPVLGLILPERLSGGVKALIGIIKCDTFGKFSALRSSMFGDNCVKWLARLSFDYDFTIYMSHPLDFSFGGDFDDKEFQNIPIKAVGEHDEVLSTCGEVAKYCLSNYPISEEVDVADNVDDLNDTDDLNDCSNYFGNASKPKYEDTVEYLHSREFYEKNAPYYDYLVPWDDPVLQETIRLSEAFEKAKSVEEQEKIIFQINSLSR